MNIGILISGRGSNMMAIADAVRSGRIPESQVAVVISDKREAGGLDRAQKLGIETLAIPRKKRTREEHDSEIIDELQKREVELVCLAGYMRLLSKKFVRAFPNKILNIHPSLLPSFPGLDAQKQAIEYGVKVSGCTVHFVDEDLDHGAVILQKVVDVRDEDTAQSLADRIIKHEHQVYVQAIIRIVEGNYKIRGRRVCDLK